MNIQQILYYMDGNGHNIFGEWHENLRDIKARTAIDRRLTRLELGNFGDVKPVGEGVCELRIHYGAGYRVYYAKTGTTIILLLCGGDKSTQSKDIKRACAYWEDWQKRKKGG